MDITLSYLINSIGLSVIFCALYLHTDKVKIKVEDIHS